MKNNDTIYLITLLSIFLLFCYSIVYSAVIPIQNIEGPYPVSVSADDLDFTWTAATGSSQIDTVTASEDILLLFKYTGAATGTVTIDSQLDEYNRENDIENYVLGSDEHHCFLYSNREGWENATGQFQIKASTSAIHWAALQLPQR